MSREIAYELGRKCYLDRARAAMFVAPKGFYIEYLKGYCDAMYHRRAEVN